MICYVCDRMTDTPTEMHHPPGWGLVCKDARGCQARIAREKHMREFRCKNLRAQVSVIRTLGGTNLDDHVRVIDPGLTRGGRETDKEFRERAVRHLDPVTLGDLPIGAKFQLDGVWYELVHTLDSGACKCVQSDGKLAWFDPETLTRVVQLP